MKQFRVCCETTKLGYYYNYAVVSVPRLFPQDVTVSLGDTVNFTCESDENVKWKFNNQNLESKAKNRVYIQSRYYWMKIDSVGMEDAGVYECYGKILPDIYFVSKSVLKVMSKFYHTVITFHDNYAYSYVIKIS